MKKEWKSSFMKMALEVSTHSTCIRLQIGCLIVKGNRIISMGYNGVPSGHKHCNDYFNEEYSVPIKCEFRKDHPEFDNMHKVFSDEKELHAEQNAISFAARNGIETDNTVLYTTMSPCNNCSKLIIAAGIKEVFYLEEYDRSIKGIALMEESGIFVVKWELNEKVTS